MKAPTLFELLPQQHAERLCKLAEEEGKAKRYARAAATMVIPPVVGMGVGMLAGAGAGHLAGKAYHAATGKHLPSSPFLAAAPYLGGGLGLAYNLAQARHMEAMRRALESPDNKPDGSVS